MDLATMPESPENEYERAARTLGGALRPTEEEDTMDPTIIGNAEPYAWPGGYPIGYVTNDGEVLCAGCVNDPTNPVHLDGDADGWRIEGFQVFEGTTLDYDGEVICVHCYKVLVADDDA